MRSSAFLSAVQVLILTANLAGQGSSPALKPMPSDADPSFEVASIKPSRPGDYLAIFIVGGRNFQTTASTLADLITYAYGVHAKQLIGAPAWTETETFNVEARPDQEGQPNGDQMRRMVRKLVVDRFGLTLHREMRELPVYRIVTAKSGPKLAPASDPNGRAGVGFRGRRGAMNVKNASLPEFAGFLQRYVLDRPVIDATGIAGKYNLDLDWRADDAMPAGRISSEELPVVPESSNLPDFFTATQQQLGLRLESTKASVEALIIDRVERPSAN